MKRTKFARVTFIGLLSSVLFVAVQCGGPVTQAPPGQPTAAGGQAQPAGKVKLVHWSMFSDGEPLQKILATATDDFMKENPDIQVEVKWAGRQVLTQLQSALAAGT